MCDLAVDLPRIARLHGRDPDSAIVDRSRIQSLIADGAVTMPVTVKSCEPGMNYDFIQIGEHRLLGNNYSPGE